MDFFGYAYAAAISLGGLMGYLKAGSVMSLCAGLTFGSLAAYGAKQISEDPTKIHILLFVSSVLSILMGYRFANSGKFMPAGLTCMLSLATVARLIVTRVLL
ncbi:transmembrane protein 14C [Galendromus occidentalis]|uniref:Transmembrane protein 14C n=1 Tax=Galendromus occidentalis TaxID=34638 RepID=A0AAJ7P9R4_9ACAR|nr:transmembrane protein 14C [Galendromus occidentalis]